MPLELISETPLFHALALELIEREPDSYAADVLRRNLKGITVQGSRQSAFTPALAITAGPVAVQEEFALEGILVEDSITTRAIPIQKD